MIRIKIWLVLPKSDDPAPATERRESLADLCRVLQELADDILGRDCERISGLKVEGRRPRALMESALLLLNRSSASTAQPRLGLEEAGLTSYAINAFVLQSQGRI